MNRLKELRRAHGLTQEDVAQTVGVQKAAICKYETDRVSIPPDTLMILCDFFGVSADYMLCRAQSAGNPLSKTTASLSGLFLPNDDAVVGVPLVGRVHAGLPMLANENITEYVPLPAADVRAGDYFYMEVEGDCMIGACIPEGALVLVRIQDRVENGQIAVVRLGDEVLLRKVKWVSGQLVLIPANTRYEPIIVAGGDVQIIGRVVEVRIRGL
ncbi:MAG: XRE family transcriptional regulator [Clostridia bacterium]|nr:XRE family transcriptional regulator [Clostridia bacterium]